MNLITESDIGKANLDVHGFKCSIEEGPNYIDAKRVIHVNQDAYVALSWTQTGFAVAQKWLDPQLHFHPRVFLEKMGPAEDAPDPIWGTLQYLVQGKASHDYKDKIKLPHLTEGVYKVVITLNIYKLGHPSSIFHSFAECGMIEVVDTP